MILLAVLTFAERLQHASPPNTSYMADAIDLRADRSGCVISPAVVSGTYSLVDKLITSFAAVIATGAVALLATPPRCLSPPTLAQARFSG